MSIQLNEDSRSKLVAKSKTGKREKDGKTRYEKRLKSHVATSTRQYNRINMNELFKNGIVTIGIEIKGETDNYIVTISYGGVLDELRELIKRNNNQLDLKSVIKALVIAFNKNDVYIRCTCPDFFYRFGYWATKNNIISGDVQLIPSDETNPKDDLGPACKHVLLVLSNTSWLIKVASVIRNYIIYMEKHMQKQYANIIYPAVYGKAYEEPVQLDIFDDDEMQSDEKAIDISNKYARTKTQFKPGNEFRIQKSEKPTEDQISIEDEENITDEVD